MNMTNIYYPQIWVAKTQIQGIVSLSLTGVIMASVVIIVVDAVPRWVRTALGKQPIVIDAIETAFVK
jgi:hypothetical protein